MRVPLLLALAVLAAGCDSSSEESKAPVECSLNVTLAAQSQPMRYTYSVSKPTAGAVASVTYRNAAASASGTGLVTVNTPVLPWSVTITMDRNVAPLLSATGSVTTGRITAKIAGVSSESTSQINVMNDRECIQY